MPSDQLEMCIAYTTMSTKDTQMMCTLAAMEEAGGVVGVEGGVEGEEAGVKGDPVLLRMCTRL